MWTKTKSLTFSLWVTRSFMLALAAEVFFLPTQLTWYLNFSNRGTEMYPSILIVMYASAVPAALVLFYLHRLLKNLRQDEVFTRENVFCLRILSWCCISVGILFGALGILYLFALLIAVAAVFFGLILRVLKNVFAYAVDLKTENDYTI